MEKGRRRYFALTPLLLGLLALVLSEGLPVYATFLRDESSGAVARTTKRVGAYFFYWFWYPDQPDDPEQHMAFHPPGVTVEDTSFHNDPYAIPYQGGPYNNAYYSPALYGANQHPQRWWEWQFRDMAEAELDFAVLNSWDGTNFFWSHLRTEKIAPYLQAALETLGSPLQLTILDDTVSEGLQWNKDNGHWPPDSYPCDYIPNPRSCPPEYLMPLSNEANFHYFLDKLAAFYPYVGREHWATLDGRSVDAGGRLLIFLGHPWYFRDFVVNGNHHGARLMCQIKKYMMETFHIPEPFLLPIGDWGAWEGSADPWLGSAHHCSEVGISIAGDPYILDGWSAYGVAGGGPYVPHGALVYSYTTDQTHTTAYVGPGSDGRNLPLIAYSGPYGGEGPNTRERGYNARWWSAEGEGLSAYCDDGRCQDRYYFQGWSFVTSHNPVPELVVIESWNELFEGTEISKITTYVGPDLMCGQGPPCPPLYFIQNPYHESPWSPWFWIFRTRDIIRDWRGGTPRPQYEVDDPQNVFGWSQGQGNLGQWFYGGWFHYVQENTPVNPVEWAFTLPQDGFYDIYAYWPYVQRATTDAHYTIVHACGTSLVRVDQSRYWDAGGWAFLGRYPFRANFLYRILLSSQVENPQGRYVLADAVRLVYREVWTPPSLKARAFLPVVFKAVSQGVKGSAPPTPSPGRPYPEPGGETWAIPPTPASVGLRDYPGPTPSPFPTPQPSPTPTPSPTPLPPDLLPPLSQVRTLPAFYNVPGFWVSWTAEDPGGSGVARILVQARDGLNGQWNDWLPYAGPFAFFGGAQHGHTYYFRSRATDWAGNVEPWPQNPDYDAFTTVDLLPPTSQVNALPPYSHGSFTVSWSGEDPTSGIASYDVQVCRDTCTDPIQGWTTWLAQTTQTSATFTGGEHGHTYHFRCRARDRAGNVEDWPASPDASTLVDTQPPTSQVNALPPYSRGSFTVSWSGEDPTSGIASYDVQVCREHCTQPRQAVWNDWLLQTTATSAPYHTEQEGPVYFRCRARDRAGNVEPYPSLPDAQTTVDRTAPTSRVSPLPLYSSASFTVTWSGEDNLSGVASYDVQVCRDTCTDPTQGWTTWLAQTAQTSATFTGGEDGHTYYFRSRARDQAGNVESWPASPDASTLVDTLPPSSQVNALPPYSQASFTVSWNGQDGASGVEFYDVQFCAGRCNEPTEGDGTWQDWLIKTNQTSATFTDGRDGQTYYFRCRAYDRAGNTEPWPATPDASTTVDAQPPESQVQGLPPYSTASFTVTWSGEDNLSGIASYDLQYCVGDCTDPLVVWTYWLRGTPYTSSLFTGGEDGRTYHFRSRAYDRAGNVEPWPASPDASTLVDALPPTSTVRPLPAYSLPAFPVSWEGRDTVSGIASYDIQVCTATCSLDTSWHDWLTYTTALSATFAGGQDGQTCYFRSRARDRIGHLEKWLPQPQAFTTVDASPPTSQVGPLPEYSPAVFTVTWSGQDAGCGLTSYDIQVCTCPDLGPGCCQDWLTNITSTAALFTGTHGQTYYFRSRARDFLGNEEDYPSEADAFTQVDAVPPTTWFEGYSSYSEAPTFLVRWNGVDKLSGLAAYSLYFRDESLPAWQPWLAGVTVTQALFTGEIGHTYYLCIQGQDRAGNIEDKECPGPAETWPIEGELVLVAPPTSRVEPLPPYAPGTSFTVRWSSTPPKTLYQVQVMDLEEGEWRDWLETPEHSALFQGQPGHTYAFRCRAQDPLSGVWEAWPWGEDTHTTLPAAEPQNRSVPGGMGSSRSTSIAWTAHGTLPRPV